MRGHLFAVGGGRIVVAPVSDLNKEQDEFLVNNLPLSDIYSAVDKGKRLSKTDWDPVQALGMFLNELSLKNDN